ncbi:MAG: aldo/keto reductase [Erysipelotrichaceae bacterium]|jgi:predicted aldo/keto reductase-like oxidoreductase|nr:aldo/keto reductase [Erysipelotrichaceae bacterium]
MKYRKFQELSLSRLGLGCMRLPTVGENGPIDKELAEAMIDRAIAGGINYFDTAYRYQNGESELVTGAALKKHPRDSFYLATKFPGHQMQKEGDRIRFVGYLAGLPEKTPQEVFEDQLQKCQVDYFDFYLLHNLNEVSYPLYSDPELGIIDYFLSEKKAGRIKHLGFSAHGPADLIDRFLTEFPVFEFVQIQLNYLDWQLQDAKGRYEVIRSHGIPVWVMEPVRGGKLIEIPPQAKKALQEVNPDDSFAKWCFRWLEGKEDAALILSGMSTMAQLEENLALFDDLKVLNPLEEQAIDRAIAAMVNLVPCTGCRYCVEDCPAQLEIPRLITLYNEFTNDDHFATFDSVKALGDKGPSACLNCHSCERICPQAIHIPEVLADFVKRIEKRAEKQ